MSKNTNSAAFGELFVDATREILEKGRIKAQMNKLERVMNTDRIRLKNIYAEIGMMYVENTLEKNKAKLRYAYKAIAHLNQRLDRAQARYDMLKEAHSVDECTESFRSELSSKIKQAQDSAVMTAYKVKKKAQDAAATLGDKADGIKNQAKETARSFYKAGNDAANNEEDAKDFSDLLAELELEEEAPQTEETAEIDAILNNIDTMLREVEEESTPDNSDSSDDGEAAGSFDF